MAPASFPAQPPTSGRRGMLTAMTAVNYGGRRVLHEWRRPTLWLGAALAWGVGWAGTHLEILGLDPRPERAWGVMLSTGETFGLLLVLSSRLRGSDLVHTEGWSEVLRASPLGAVGLCAAETAAAAAAGVTGAITCAALLIVFRIQESPPGVCLLGWAVALLAEFLVLSSWLSLAATWLGRLPGLVVALALLGLGRLGLGGALGTLLPAPTPTLPALPSIAALIGAVAAAAGLTALSAGPASGTRTFD